MPLRCHTHGVAQKNIFFVNVYILTINVAANTTKMDGHGNNFSKRVVKLLELCDKGQFVLHGDSVTTFSSSSGRGIQALFSLDCRNRITSVRDSDDNEWLLCMYMMMEKMFPSQNLRERFDGNVLNWKLERRLGTMGFIFTILHPKASIIRSISIIGKLREIDPLIHRLKDENHLMKFWSELVFLIKAGLILRGGRGSPLLQMLGREPQLLLTILEKAREDWKPFEMFAD